MKLEFIQASVIRAQAFYKVRANHDFHLIF